MKVQKNGNDYYIIHDTNGAYKDKLVSHGVKIEQERALVERHVEMVKLESTVQGRRWRFHLRNNAAKRLAYWRQQNENV